MPANERTYIAIDLKSFYASVECVERGLDPLDTNLVVADRSRTEKTICLAVSPSLKAHGLGGRPRLFEVVQRVRAVNNDRRASCMRFSGKSVFAGELARHADWEVDFLVATPRMAHYIEYSTRIYKIYLKYVAPEDIHVYSIDEVFIDATSYLRSAGMTAHRLAKTIIRDVLRNTGITATAGIGTNMYLSKVAMDIVAKHMPADSDGVRIAWLDEMTYRRKLWSHKPITDFWRVGSGIAARLAAYGILTMGDIARASIDHEDFLYGLFGVNAELLIDHAWGWEPATIEHVKAYRPASNSISSGQVLTEAYTTDRTRVVMREMAEAVAFDLLEKRMMTDQIVLTVGYDVKNITDGVSGQSYAGPVVTDHFGRLKPRHAHGTANLGRHTSSAKLIRQAADELFDRIIIPGLLVRRINITANHVVPETMVKPVGLPLQMDLFTDYEALGRRLREEEAAIAKERRLMEATIAVKRKFGKNSLLKGLNYMDGSTARARNAQIGGHKA